MWPNSDAGSDDISRGIRKWREQGKAGNMHFFKNLPIDTYVKLLNRTACLVGNSSSGIREGAYIGTPVVNIGSRQDGRQRASNVVDVTFNSKDIYNAIINQVSHGRYLSDPIYGDGSSGRRIADILATLPDINVQKRITY